MSFMGSRHRLMPSTHRTYIVNHPRLQHHNRVPPLPNQLRLRVIMDSSQAPSPSPASAAQTKQTESKMSKTNSLSLRVSGSESGSSAILYCRETLPSFNMAPSLLRRKDENDGSSPEDGPGGYNFSQRRMIKKDKRIVLLRHGQSNWNKFGRIQGDTNVSDLTQEGILQGQRCAHALSSIDFDACYHSPLTRAAHTARIIWEWKGDGQEDSSATNGRDPEKLIEVDELKEAHLYDIQGLTNEDAARMFPEEYERWRNDPRSLCMKGHFPVQQLYIKARFAWDRIIGDDKNQDVLVVSHKSMIRALLSTSLGLDPSSFRSFNVHNGGYAMRTNILH